MMTQNFLTRMQMVILNDLHLNGLISLLCSVYQNQYLIDQMLNFRIFDLQMVCSLLYLQVQMFRLVQNHLHQLCLVRILVYHHNQDLSMKIHHSNHQNHQQSNQIILLLDTLLILVQQQYLTK